MTAGALSLGGQDPLEACPAMAILNGDHPARVSEAARISLSGYGATVWLTNDPRSGDVHTPDAGTDSNIGRLVELGVPAAAIHVLSGAATGTRAELALVRSEAERRRLPCVLTVTSPWHAPRVKATWLRAGLTPRLVVRHAPDAAPVGWWGASREVAGAVLALLGLR